VVTGADYVLQAVRLHRSGPGSKGPNRSDLGEA
jgi:hypothetical protein